MKIQVSDLKPNPFRHLDRYPINQDKVDALKQSIKDTTFWDNLLVRKAPNGSGGYEIAYGHHRLRALKDSHVREIDVPVRSLDDTAMAKIMAHENMEEWGHSTTIEQETVRSIIEGYGEGKIELPNPKSNQGMRYAPHFAANSHSDSGTSRPYNVETLAKFLGWKSYKVEATLAALSLIEQKLATDTQFAGLSTKQAQTVAMETRRVAKETGKPDLARAVGKKLAAGMRQSSRGRDRAGHERNVKDVTIHNARQRANEMMGKNKIKPPKTQKIPPIDDFAESLGFALAEAFPTPRWKEKLDAIIKYREHMTAGKRNFLIRALRALAGRASGYADKLEG